MPLKKIELPKQTFIFSDGQTVELKAPTLAQIQNAEKRCKGDDIERAKLLLIDMSDGELDSEFLLSLPVGEWVELAKNISDFMGIEIKN
ncbi:hypothetical protein [Campylobacter sp. RM16187]|uniref:hypothetical protein n=1 Tax=Campylobacter sp. RM16187 TaxID=1660063 RepID=UPI0021B54839|nr:hypothetical protein [Campylobacter sp. RM16187]QKG29208.1 hypothetical protein CDOMF_0946 [Campylobacter sp. RM16187]